MEIFASIIIGMMQFNADTHYAILAAAVILFAYGVQMIKNV